jgi:hypothetical protein
MKTLRTRAAPLLLIGGAVVAAIVSTPHLPHEHHVGLSLAEAATVTRVDAAWSDGSDAVRAGSWHFQAGSAPAMVDTRVSLPNGRYELDVVVERGADRQAFHRRVTLGEADHITVPLR